MPSAFLESTLLSACPGLRDGWDAVRLTHSADSPAGDDELLIHVRVHVVGLLAGGRVAEFTRFARAIERLLAEADPILHDMLRDDLLRPLARDVEDARVSPTLVMPYLGPRARAAWRADA